MSNPKTAPKTARTPCFGCLAPRTCTVVNGRWHCAECAERDAEAARERRQFERDLDNWREFYGDEG